MRSVLSLGAACVALSLALPAIAQTPAPAAPVPFASAEDIQALIAKAKAQAKPGVPTISQPILKLAPYQENLEYRTEKGPAAVHENEAEVFVGVEGSGTIVIGGQLTNSKRTNEHNLSGDGITGGASFHLTKGAMLIVPQGQPHQVVSVDGGGALVVMTLHVPRT